MIIGEGQALLALDKDGLLALARALEYLKGAGRWNQHLEHLRCDIVPIVNEQQWGTPRIVTDLTSREAGSYLGLSTRRICQLASQGILKGTRRANNTWQFTYKAVELYQSLYNNAGE
jgi:hypothetical protein